MGDPGFQSKTNSTQGKDPAFKKAELDYMKLIEQMNLERVKKLQVQARKNRITGAAIGASVFGIYLYSIFAVKQETFLDDFNEPVKVQKE